VRFTASERSKVRCRHQRAEIARGRDQSVEPAPALEDLAAELVDPVAVSDVERDQGGVLARGREHRIVQRLEPALGARGGDQMGARLGQPQGDGAADPAAGAGDQGDPALQG
jgi:hypothetical protein